MTNPNHDYHFFIKLNNEYYDLYLDQSKKSGKYLGNIITIVRCNGPKTNTNVKIFKEIMSRLENLQTVSTLSVQKCLKGIGELTEIENVTETDISRRRDERIQKTQAVATALTLSTTTSVASSKYAKWRQVGPPEIKEGMKLQVDLSGISEKEAERVKELCLKDYESANEALEHSIGDTALRYVHRNGNLSNSERGPLLEFTNLCCRRYLDLYRAYVEWEISENIPMLPVQAGQLKYYGFNTREILGIQDICRGVTSYLESLHQSLLKLFGEKGKPNVLNAAGENLYRRYFDILTDKKKRAEFLKGGSHPEANSIETDFAAFLKTYHSHPQSEMIDRIRAKMAGSNQEGIENQIAAVANMSPNYHASPDERLLMEMRCRFGGDGTTFQKWPGWLGSNPLAYLNIAMYGEPNNLEAEFRNQMYFIYMSSLLANTLMGNPAFVQNANAYLKEEKSGWQIDSDFIQAMNDRGLPNVNPPVFRYGVASITGLMREYVAAGEKANKVASRFYATHPIPTIEQATKGTAPKHALFRFKLSPRELLVQRGDMDFSKVDRMRQLNFVSGGSLYRMKDLTELSGSSPAEVAAKKYLGIVRELRIPSTVGISGTADQIMTIGGVVGIGLNSIEEMQLIRLACIAFMVPTGDHSVDEIMQSARTYGLEYEPGPGFERYIFPDKSKEFIAYLEEAQKERSSRLPSYYLSASHAQELYRKLNNRGSEGKSA